MIKSNKKGFTLIELLVVIAIIGILSSVVIASMNSARQKSRDARRISDIANVKTALEMSYDKNGQVYPASSGVTAATFATDLAGLVTDNLIPSLPKDPVAGSATNYYVYAASKTDGTACTAAAKDCQSYHLASILEDSANPALANDADSTAIFDGAKTGCAAAGAATDNCYDVKP